MIFTMKIKSLFKICGFLFWAFTKIPLHLDAGVTHFQVCFWDEHFWLLNPRSIVEMLLQRKVNTDFSP